MSDTMDSSRCVLVLVDYQSRLLPAIDEVERVVAQAVLLADAARALGVRVVGTEQNPSGLGPNAPKVRERCEKTLSKMHFDACEDGLAEALIEGDPGAHRPEVVIAGCEGTTSIRQRGAKFIGPGETSQPWQPSQPWRVMRTLAGHRRSHRRGVSLLFFEVTAVTALRY